MRDLNVIRLLMNPLRMVKGDHPAFAYQIQIKDFMQIILYIHIIDVKQQNKVKPRKNY